VTRHSDNGCLPRPSNAWAYRLLWPEKDRKCESNQSDVPHQSHCIFIDIRPLPTSPPNRTSRRSQPKFFLQLIENNKSRSPNRPTSLVRRATLVLGGTILGSCAMRTTFSSSEAITPNRACHSSATVHYERFFNGNKGVSIQKTTHHERFCPSTAPRPAKNGFVW